MTRFLTFSFATWLVLSCAPAFGQSVRAASASPAAIARSATTIYIQAKEGGAISGFPAEPLEKKLLENPNFLAMGYALTNNRHNADLLIELDRPAVSWDCTYRLTDQRSGLILGAGKNIDWDCIRAAPFVADHLVNRLRQLRATLPAQ